MLLDQETLRYIFGFKLRGLRQDRNLSLKELAKLSGLSASYINEIEKGKKYPKSEKIMTLAHSLGVPYDDLISLRLKDEMGIVSKILERNLLHELPFDVFGVPARMLFDLMAERPLKFSALIGTILEIARIHNIGVEDLFSATLRAQLDMQGHYFPELEDKARQLRRETGLTMPTVESLGKILKEKFGCQVLEKDFAGLEGQLHKLHFYLSPGTPPKFIVNSRLSQREKVFILAKECAQHDLGLKERVTSSLGLKADSYQSLHDNFRASYFAGSLIMPKDKFVEETKDFFMLETWDAARFSDWVKSYPGSYSSFFYRLSQILPRFFKMDEMFFLRFRYNPKTDTPVLMRELHLAELHAPHKVKSGEHYCRRWITTSLLKKLAETDDELMAGIQRSRFWGTSEEYLCFSLAFNHELSSSDKECVTVGLRVNDKLRQTIRFLDDPRIPRRDVCDTCERCGITDCKVRMAPPTILEERRQNDEMLKALERVRGS